MSSNTDPLRQRVQQLEELLSFQDRSAETSARELAEMSRRMVELAGRIERLEARLRSLTERVDAAEPPPPDERPPHSAGRPLEDELR
jgi:uncharacterized coiled-coil protein SlyX